MQDYEKLGCFYLGQSYDLEMAARRDDLILYDAKDLTTHAMIIGMTGSGKTGFPREKPVIRTQMLRPYADVACQSLNAAQYALSEIYS